MQNERYRSLVAVYVKVTNAQGEILLLRRANTGYRDGYYDMPAGHLEEGETPRRAMVRELAEETGLIAQEEDIQFLELLHRVSGDRVYLDIFFELKTWQGEPAIMEPEKCDDLGWFSRDSLPKIVPHQGQVLEDMANGCTYREFIEDTQTL